MAKFLESYKTLKTTLKIQKMKRENEPIVDVKNSKVLWGTNKNKNKGED